MFCYVSWKLEMIVPVAYRFLMHHYDSNQGIFVRNFLFVMWYLDLIPWLLKVFCCGTFFFSVIFSYKSRWVRCPCICHWAGLLSQIAWKSKNFLISGTNSWDCWTRKTKRQTWSRIDEGIRSFHCFNSWSI